MRHVRLERTLLVVGVLALGYNLRGAITSLPPVFPELQASLRLSGATISILAATPVICFGVVSGFAASLARRAGEERVLFGAMHRPGGRPARARRRAAVRCSFPARSCAAARSRS